MRQFLEGIAKRSRGEASSEPHFYCHGTVLPDMLVPDCPPPASLTQQKELARCSLWISGGGASSPLHYDLPSVLLCQLRGRKRVYLYLPAHHDRLRPRGSTFPALHAQERIATTQRAALAGALGGLSVELRPGDALLMPSGWWHEVDSVADEQDDAVAGADGLSGCVISIGMNWPHIADAIPNFARWRDQVHDYPILTQGQVLTQFYGAETVQQMPGFAQVRDLSVFA